MLSVIILTHHSSQKFLEESFSVGVPVSLRTASTSRSPAAPQFPPAQKIYHLTTRDLQLSAALLFHSQWMENHIWLECLRRIARTDVKNRAVIRALPSHHCEWPRAKQTRAFFFNQVKLNKLNGRWHLCLFGCKHINWLSLCRRAEQQVSLCIYGCSGQRAASALGFTLWNRYGWAAFLRPNPKSAVDGQTTQLSALIGAQWGRSLQRQPPCHSPLGRKWISRLFVKYTVRVSSTINGHIS